MAVNGLLTIGTLRSTNPNAVQVQGDPSVVDPQISWTMSNWQRVDPRS